MLLGRGFEPPSSGSRKQNKANHGHLSPPHVSEQLTWSRGKVSDKMALLAQHKISPGTILATSLPCNINPIFVLTASTSNKSHHLLNIERPTRRENRDPHQSLATSSLLLVNLWLDSIFKKPGFRCSLQHLTRADCCIFRSGALLLIAVQRFCSSYADCCIRHPLFVFFITALSSSAGSNTYTVVVWCLDSVCGSGVR